MYIALYDIDLAHIANLTQAGGDIITKVYDFDEIHLSGQSTGVTTAELDRAKVFRLNEDDGREVYSGFVYKAKKDKETVSIIGKDFRTIFDTETFFDYFEMGTVTTLGDFVQGVFSVFALADTEVRAIPIEISAENLTENHTEVFGEIIPELVTANAYEYLLPALKYFEYRLAGFLDWTAGKIIFEVTKERETHSIRLKDFEHELTRNEPQTNKTIALLKHSEFGWEWAKVYGYVPTTAPDYVFGEAAPAGRVFDIRPDWGIISYNDWAEDGSGLFYFFKLQKETRIHAWKLQVYYWDTTPTMVWFVNPHPVDGANTYYTATGATRTAREYRDLSYPVNYLWVPDGQFPPGGVWMATGNIRKEYEFKRYDRHTQDVVPLQIVYSLTLPEADEGFKWTRMGDYQSEWNDTEDPEIYEMTAPRPPEGYRWVRRDETETEMTRWRKTYWKSLAPPELIFSVERPEPEENALWVLTGHKQIITGAIRYYYLTQDNKIVEGDEAGDVSGRYYPVKTRVFVDEYLATAQAEALYELANNRYLDTITIDADSPLNPIDLSAIRLFDWVTCFDGGAGKKMPVSEKHLSLTEKGLDYKIKLGFKKEKITDIIFKGR